MKNIKIKIKKERRNFATEMLDKSFISEIHRDGARSILTPQQTVTKYDINQKEAKVHPFNHVPGTTQANWLGLSNENTIFIM